MKAIRFFPIIFLLLSFSLIGQTQDRHFERDCDDRLICVDFERILDNILLHLDKGQGDEAFKELKALEACDKCPEHRDNIDSLSNDIVQLFARQNQKLKDQNDENERQRRELEQTIIRLDRVLIANEETTREALVNNYILRLARSLYKEQENDFDVARQQKTWSKVLWLTDFTYNYVDSTHHEVKKMMYELYHDRLLEDLPDGYFIRSFEEGLSGEELEAVVTAVEGSPDERWLAVGLNNGRLLIFDSNGNVRFDDFVSTQELSVLTWDPDSDPQKNRLAFVADGSSLGLVKETIDGWEKSPQAIWKGTRLLCLRWSPNDSIVAAGDTEGNITLFNVEQDAIFSTLEGGHEDWVRDIAWSPDGRYFAACDDLGKILIWDWENERVHRDNFAGHTDYARTVDWHPDGETIISGGDDYQLIFWDTTGQKLASEEFNGWVYQARYNYDASQIGVVAGSVYYNLKGEERFESPFPNGVGRFGWLGHRSTALVSDGSLVGFEQDAFFKVPTGESSNLIAAAEIKALSWSPDERYLAYSKGNSLMVASEGKLAEINFETASALSLSWRPLDPNGEEHICQLAVSLDNQDLFLLDMETMTTQYVEMDVLPLSISWSPDGHQLAAGTRGGDLVLFGDDLQEVFRISLHDDFIRSVDWSPNGQFIATGADDKTAVVFEVAKRQIADRFTGHTDWIRDVLWIDNQHLVTASDDSESIVWRFPRDPGATARSGPNRDQSVSFPIHLSGLSGYLYSVAFYALPIAEVGYGYLAVGSGQNQLGLYLIDNNFNITLEEIYELDGVANDLAWQSKTRTKPLLVIGKRDRIPEGVELSLDPGPKPTFLLEELEYDSFDYWAMRKRTNQDEKAIYLPHLSTEPGQFANLTWSADERLMALINAEKTIEIHDMQQSEVVHRHKPDSLEYERLVFSPDAKYLAATRAFEEVSIWKLEPSLDTTIFHITQEIADWAWSADSRYLYLLDRRFGLHRYDTRNQETTLVNNELLVDTVLCDGAIAAHPQDPDRIYILTQKRIYKFNPYNGSLSVVHEGYAIWDEDESCKKLSGSWLQDGDVFVFEREGTGPQFLKVGQRGFSLIGEALNPDIHYAWGDISRSILCEIYKIEEKDDNLYDAGDRSFAQIWDLEAREVIMVVEDVENQFVKQLEVSSNGKFFATLGAPIVFDEDSQKYMVRGEPYISLWEVSTQLEIMQLEVSEISHFEFSPQGNYLVTYHENGNLGLWPLDIVKVSQYMQKQGKDNFLRSSLGKNTVSLQDQIKNWQLQEGLEFRDQYNRRLLQEREQPMIRDNWSKYYIDRARFSLNAKDKEDNFAKAIAVHQKGTGNNVIPTKVDSVALSDIYLERMYDALKEQDLREGQRWLQRSRQLGVSQQRLEAIDFLLTWWRKPAEPIEGFLTCLLDGVCQTAMQREFNLWEERRLNIPWVMDLRRILALAELEYDPVSPLQKPFIEDLLQGYPEAEKEILLFRYFRVNATNPKFSRNEREAFLRSAAAFWEDRYERIGSDEQLLRDYLEFSDNLQSIAEDKQKWDRAFEWAEKRLKAIRLLQDLQPDIPNNQTLYEVQFANYQRLNLQLNPRKASAVSAAITKLLAQSGGELYPTTLLQIQKGHAELLAQKPIKDVMDNYYPVLTNDEYSFGPLASYILDELDLMETNRRDEVKTAFNKLEVLYQANSDFSEQYERDLMFSQLNGEPIASLDAFRELYELANSRVRYASDLDDLVTFSEEEIESLKQDQKTMLANYAYKALFNGNWPLFKELANTARLEYKAEKWPIAMNAIGDLLNGSWPAAKTKLRAVVSAPNDGFLPNRYPYLADFLKDLPASVKETPQYQANAALWLGVLNE